MSDTTDVPDDLVAAAMTGDREAVGRVLTIIRPLVVRYCRARLGAPDRSSASADDVAQEVCLAVLTAKHTSCATSIRRGGRPVRRADGRGSSAQTSGRMMAAQ